MVRRAAVALAAVCFFLGAVDAALARSSRRHRQKRAPQEQKAGGSPADGKSHLKRAHALAGEGDCAAAIEEYTKAFEILGDPVVLFNRAECYRRTGDNESAVDDYRAFLEKVPNAPNRADIEAKILALDAPEPAARPPAAEATSPPSLKPAAPPPKPVPASPPALAAAPAPEARPQPAAAVVTAAPVDESDPAGGTRPWVWLTLASVAVAAAVGSYLLFRPSDESPPASALGNYRF